MYHSGLLYYICFDYLKSSFYINAVILHIPGKDYESKFIRTCPVGVKSCFGAKGFYDRDDEKVSNDICKLKFFLGIETS